MNLRNCIRNSVALLAREGRYNAGRSVALPICLAVLTSACDGGAVLTGESDAAAVANAAPSSVMGPATSVPLVSDDPTSAAADSTAVVASDATTMLADAAVPVVAELVPGVAAEDIADLVAAADLTDLGSLLAAADLTDLESLLAAADVVDSESVPAAADVVVPAPVPAAAEVVDPAPAPAAAEVVDLAPVPAAAEVVDPAPVPAAAEVVDPAPVPAAAEVVDPATVPAAAEVVDPAPVPAAAEVVDLMPVPAAAEVVDLMPGPAAAEAVDLMPDPAAADLVDPMPVMAAPDVVEPAPVLAAADLVDLVSDDAAADLVGLLPVSAVGGLAGLLPIAAAADLADLAELVPGAVAPDLVETLPDEAATALIANSSLVGPIRVMAVGDSITHGVAGASSYRQEFTSLMEAANCSFEMVGSQQTSLKSNRDESCIDTGNIGDGWGWDGTQSCLVGVDADNDTYLGAHEGYSAHRADHFLTGHTSSAGTNDGISISMGAYDPDVVLLHVGSVDMYNQQTVPSTLVDIKNLVNTIYETKPETLVLIANIVPWFSASPYADIGDDVALIGDGIEQYVAIANNPLLKLVNVREGFTASMMLADQIHPNEVGELHIANAFMDVYQSIANCAAVVVE